MKIKTWGARGSIPVSGHHFNKYGGDTPCIEIESKGGAIIIIDAGTGIRRLGNHLLHNKQTHLNLIFTHAHWDHIMGFPFFKPLYFSQTNINIYGPSSAQGSIKNILSTTMSPPNFPLKLNEVKATLQYNTTSTASFCIDTITITPIPLSHPNKGFGYRFEEEGKSFVFLTDNELGYQHEGGLHFNDYCTCVAHTDLLIHDAEFTREEYKRRKTWGHSTYEDALKLALKAKVKRFGIFHHNQERTDTEIDSLVQHCRALIKAEKQHLTCFGVTQDYEITL